MGAASGRDLRALKRPAFDLGPRVFDATHFESLADAGIDEESLVGKALAASGRVNDREAAENAAKKR